MDTYLTYDMFEPQVKSPEQYSIVNDHMVLGGFNTAREVYVKQMTDIEYSFTTYQDTAEDRKTLKEFFISKRGRLLPFWYISPVPLGRVQSISETSISIEDISLLYWIKYNNLFIYEPITGYKGKVQTIDKRFAGEFGKQEVLNLREPVAAEITEGSFLYIMTFARFDHDSLFFNAESYQTTTTKLKIKELQADIIKLGL